MTKEEFYARYDVGNNPIRCYPMGDKDEGPVGWHIYICTFAPTGAYG